MGVDLPDHQVLVRIRDDAERRQLDADVAVLPADDQAVDVAVELHLAHGRRCVALQVDHHIGARAVRKRRERQRRRRVRLARARIE
jgi:hypothetical protein